MKTARLCRLRREILWRVNGTEYEYTVMLPEGYDANVEYSYPVVYMLPEDGYASWSEGITEELTEVMASDQSMDMIVVLPTFDEENDFRTVLQAVTENVDEDYRTLADSAHRAAAGVGVGGYMAYIAGLTDAQTGEGSDKPVYIWTAGKYQRRFCQRCESLVQYMRRCVRYIERSL